MGKIDNKEKSMDDHTMLSSDRHSWKGTNVCVKCGCEKHSIGGYTWYSRTGHTMEKSPECIDWEIEDQKTID